MESAEIKSRCPFSTETYTFYCLEIPGGPWPAALGFPGLPGSKMYEFLTWRDFLFYYGLCMSLKISFCSISHQAFHVLEILYAMDLMENIRSPAAGYTQRQENLKIAMENSWNYP